MLQDLFQGPMVTGVTPATCNYGSAMDGDGEGNHQLKLNQAMLELQGLTRSTKMRSEMMEEVWGDQTVGNKGRRRRACGGGASRRERAAKKHPMRFRERCRCSKWQCLWSHLIGGRGVQWRWWRPETKKTMWIQRFTREKQKSTEGFRIVRNVAQIDMCVEDVAHWVRRMAGQTTSGVHRSRRRSSHYGRLSEG